ncbi:hypothetical protein Mame01_04780 [Microbispora amethystogenes]|nr:hypothetical protein Mame01_04780 [Microbispora amethystogenes]
MDLFDADSEHLPRLNNPGDGNWWERLTANSPLWSSEGALAREYVPIVDPTARKHASRFDDSAESPNSAHVFETRGGNASDTECTGDETASGASCDGACPDSVRGADSGNSAGVSCDALAGAPGGFPGGAPGAVPGGASDGASGAGWGDAGRGQNAGSERDAGGASGGIPGGAAGAASGGACGAGSSSWVAVAAVGEAARAVALVAVPESAEVCLAEAEELLAARDRISSALAARVGRVHRSGEAKNHGHASTRLWLRSVGGMTIPGAGRLVTMGVELGRLSRVRERFAEGSLAEGIVEAICTATAGLTDEQAITAEGILLELAGSAGAAEVAKAGRYLRAVLDPDGHESDEQADFDRRFFRVRRRRNGGLEGEFYLPVEAAARLQHLLDVYAKPKAEGDDRTPSVRNADAFIAFLENKIATELLVLVNAESLPDDPPADEPSREPAGTDPSGDPADSSADHPTSDPVDTDPSDGPGPNRSGTGTGPSPDPDPSGTDPGSGPDPDPGSSGAHPSETGYSDAGFLDAGFLDASFLDASFLDTEPGDDPGPEPGSGYDPVPGPDACAAADCGSDACATRAATTCAGATCAGATCAGAADATGESSAADSASDPPPEHGDPPGTHIGESPGGDCPAGDYRHAFAPGEAPHGMRGAGSDAPSGAEGSTWPRAGSGAPPGSGDRAWAEGSARLGGDAQVGGEAWSGGSARRGGGVWAGSGVGVNSPPPGVWLRGLPGLILATGHLLPVASVHRLARTSALVRIVMDAGGQVLDMGRKVRLATPAQRRAVFARYATCWVDGCPLPATLCQIDHAEDWCSGGLTDLKLLGPACQFHNRDRYRHPTRYTRRKIEDDRWAFTYRNPRTTRLRV